MESVSRPRRLLGARSFAPAADWRARLLRHAWLLPLLVIALWLRLASIGSEHLYGDEAEYAIVARYLSRDLAYLAYPAIEGFGATPFVSQPPLVLYTMAFSMKLFGPTDFAAIFPSVLFGAATVAAVYALGNRLGGRIMAVGGAALLAVLPFHVEMSRRAMLDSGYVFFLVLTAYFLVAWIQDRSRGAAVGVGVATAGACLSKLPGVLAGPVVLAVFFLALGVTLTRKAMKRSAPGEVKETFLHGGLGALPVAIAGLAYLGLLWYLSALGNLWNKLRWQLGRVDTDQAQIQELAAVSRDASFYFTDPHFSFQDQLGGLVFALAIVGLGVSLLRFALTKGQKLEHLVVPLFMGVLLAFFLYSDRKEGFYLLPFAPFATILVAYAGDGLKRLLQWGGLKTAPRFAARMAPAAIAVALLLVAVPAYSSATKSVKEFVRQDNQEKYFGYGTKDAALWIQENDPDAAQYGTLLGRFSLHWYNEQPAFHWYVDHTYIESQIQSGDLKYIVYDDYLQLAFDREFMRDMISKYNGEAVKTFRAGWGEVTVFEMHP